MIVVSGRYTSSPGSNERSIVHLSADNRDLDSELGGGAGTLDEFLSSLSIITGARFVNEVNTKAGSRIRWIQHDSSLDRTRLDEMLASVGSQTSLEFQKRRRPVDVWSILEE